MRGQKMRCPNLTCRTIFEIREAGPDGNSGVDAGQKPPAPDGSRPWENPPTAQHTSGSVGDMIPILPAEEVTPEPVAESSPTPPPHVVPPQPQETPSWRQPPPVR